MVGASGDAPCFEPGCSCCTQWRALDDVHLEQLAAERARVQFLVDWADGQGLLGDGVFTFPDGEAYETTKRKAEDAPSPDAPPVLAGPPHVDHPADGYRYEGCPACAV